MAFSVRCPDERRAPFSMSTPHDRATRVPGSGCAGRLRLSEETAGLGGIGEAEERKHTSRPGARTDQPLLPGCIPSAPASAGGMCRVRRRIASLGRLVLSPAGTHGPSFPRPRESLPLLNPSSKWTLPPCNDGIESPTPDSPFPTPHSPLCLLRRQPLPRSPPPLPPVRERVNHRLSMGRDEGLAFR